MAYCTADQVKSEFKSLDTSQPNSVIKDADIDEYVAEADAEINAIIGMRYVVPVTGGDALTLCRRMSRAIAGERIAARLGVKTGLEAKTEQQTVGKMTRVTALQIARDIADGKVAFSGATPLQSANGVASGDCAPRVFRRGEDQW